MRLRHPLITCSLAFLWIIGSGGCGRSGALDILVEDGMVHIPAGEIVLGPPLQMPPGPVGSTTHPPPPSQEAGPRDPRQPSRKTVSLFAPANPNLDQALWTSQGGMQLAPIPVWVEPFWMDITEVTRSAYREFLVATHYRPPHVNEPWADEGWNWNGVDFPTGTGDHPVVLTNWGDAREYCRWRGKRLPTEAEWQLAALGAGAEARRYPWGSAYSGDKLNHGRSGEPNFDDSDGFLLTAPVGSFPEGRSPYGLMDAFGNAWEFTSDLRVDSWDLIQREERDGVFHEVRSLGPGLYAAVRGGSYFFDLEPYPEGERNHFLVELRRKTSGFRCAR